MPSPGSSGVTSYKNESQRSAEPQRTDAEGVLQLRDDDVDGSSGRVASDQRLRQIRHHEPELHHAQKNLQEEKKTSLGKVFYLKPRQQQCGAGGERATRS